MSFCLQNQENKSPEAFLTILLRPWLDKTKRMDYSFEDAFTLARISSP